MFERFTEAARRSLFYARATANERGGIDISPEDLLCGLLRAAPMLVRFSSRQATLLRGCEERLTGFRPSTSSTREVPFSAAVQRALERSAQEADTFGHRRIHPEHVLLGLLRDEHSEVGRTLHEAGVTLRDVRRELAAEGEPAERPTTFGRFTELARRSLFFARFSAHVRGADRVTNDDLLDGLLRAAPNAVRRLAPTLTARSRGELSAGKGETEIQLGVDLKNAISDAGAEADALGHTNMGPKHLLLGLLRNEHTDAWRRLTEAGVSLPQVRRVLDEEGEPSEWAADDPLSLDGF